MSSRSKLGARVVAAVGVCAAVPTHAEEFSWQLSGGTNRVEGSDISSVDATYFVNPIDDSASPHALAPFLHPTTRVSASASQHDSDDPTAYRLSGAYLLPGDKWYVGANYAKTDGDDTPPTVSSDLKGYGILAGRYLGANTTLELGFGRSEQTLQFDCPPPLCIAPRPISFENRQDSVDLEVFHVRRFRSLTYSLQGRVSETEFEGGFVFDSQGNSLPSDDSSTRVYSVAGELFPTNRLGVLVGYSRPDTDFLDSDGYNVAATWFFKPRIAVQFSLTRTSFDGVPADVGDVDSASVRFFGRL